MSRLSVAVLTCGQATRDLRSLSKGLSFVFLRVSAFRFVRSTDLGPHSSNSLQGGAKFPYVVWSASVCTEPGYTFKRGFDLKETKNRPFLA